MLTFLIFVSFSTQAASPVLSWDSASRFRLQLTVDARGRQRSHSPAAAEIDFQKVLRTEAVSSTFDEHTIEVFPLDRARGRLLKRVPHRIDRLFGNTRVTLHFVIPDERHTNYAIYFDTLQSGHGKPKRYTGLVGDGDRFSERYGRRQIGVSHFDCFVDFDGDGDLELFKGGVEPFVRCYENVGGNRLVDRGLLSSGGKLFTLPCSRSNRSWLTVAFYDIDGDGDQDFFPSFGDGPDAGKIVFYRNTTREHDGELTFTRTGPLQTISGASLAGGAQAGGWFPSINLVTDWDGDGAGPDALVGSNHRCWLYRHAGTSGDGSPVFAEAVAVQAASNDIVLVNPRFDGADVDGDGDLDLFAGTQPGPVFFFRNTGTSAKPDLAPGKVVAWDGKYLIGDAHSGVKVADFTGDSLLDVVSGRFWERADLKATDAPHDFGGLWRNIGGTERSWTGAGARPGPDQAPGPRFARSTRRAPFTEQIQLCDAVRQNSVRAADWNGDSKVDLLAGDTDGFIWFFRNNGEPLFPTFDTGERLLAAGKPLHVTTTGGHARFDVCDWNNDGRKDLVVADGSGTVSLFLNGGSKSKPALSGGERLSAAGTPIQLGGRASVLVCDWNNDGRKDLVLADDKGFYFAPNVSTDRAPSFEPPKPILFGGKAVSYVRPNLGSFIDWDGDGKPDLIAGHFENSIRFYHNVGSNAPGGEPRFADPEGVVIVQGEAPQMISGVEAVDWNADGDIDVLTGQGHGGSGLRFYERDGIEDELHNTHPTVTIGRLETKHHRPGPNTKKKLP